MAIAPETAVGPKPTDGQNPKVDEAVAKLDKIVTSLFEDSEQFKLFLRYKGAMHNYSWLNTLLIIYDYQQRKLDGPVVTMGYKGWKKQGRQVRSGSKAIPLFKPVLQYWREYDPEGNQWDSQKKQFYFLRSRLLGFEIIHKTFHIQDTDGPDYEAPEPIKLEDDSPEVSSAYDRLADAAEKLGIKSIEHVELPPEFGGVYDPASKRIQVNRNNSRSQQLKTLAHEISHHVCYDLKLAHHDRYRATRGAAEAVVEGAAFIVMSFFNFDSSQFSAPYIAGWGQDLDLIKALLRDMSKVADKITKELVDE